VYKQDHSAAAMATTTKTQATHSPMDHIVVLPLLRVIGKPAERRTAGYAHVRFS